MPLNPSADIVFADGPLGAPYTPYKPDVRRIFKQLEQGLDAFSSGAGSIAKSSKAQLVADLNHDADVTAWVYNDPTVGNNGIYRKSGASAAGSWTRILDLPFSFIVASDAGAGTPNAIQATTSIPVSSSSLVVLPITTTNTDSPVSVSFNDGPALNIKTSAGQDVAPGGLPSGYISFGIASGSTFRLLSEQLGTAFLAELQAMIDAASQLATPGDATVTDPKIADVLSVVITKVITDRHSLASLDPARFNSVNLANQKQNGIFDLRDYADYSAVTSADVSGGHYVRSIEDTSKVWVLRNEELNPLHFGAKLNDIDNDLDAFTKMWSVARVNGQPIRVPAGVPRLDLGGQTMRWDFTPIRQKGFTMSGAGLGISAFRIVNAPSGGLGWHMCSDADWYDLVLRDFSIHGAHDGPLLTMGYNDYRDPLNITKFENMGIFNSLNVSTAEALRLNYVVNSVFDQTRCNGYADGLGNNNGVALRLRQVQFCSFINGSYGNARYGVRMTDGFSTTCTWLNSDLENVDYAVGHNSANSGLHKFQGCQISLVKTFAVTSSAGLSSGTVDLDLCNFSESNNIDPANHVGVTMRDRRPISTPSMPASGAVQTNVSGKTILISFWGGAVSYYTLNGDNRAIGGSGSFIVKGGDTFSLTYSGTPTWRWDAFIA